MKRTRKLILALVVVMSLLMAMAVAVIPASAATPEVITVYFRNDWMWTNIRVHIWDSSLSSYNTNWNNRKAMTKTAFKDSGYDIYSVQIPSDASFLFTGTKNDGSGAMDQSPDIKNSVSACTVWYMHWNNGNKVSKLSTVPDGIHTYASATCTSAKKCTACGKTCGSALAHTYANWTVTTAPGCETKGVETGTCSCGATSTREVAAVGHNYVAGEIVDPTCTAGGYTVYNCSGCGDAENRDATPEKGHSMAPATCTDPSTCKNGCGLTEGEALGHDWNDATCTDPKTCGTCGATEGGPVHATVTHVASKAATCTENGNIEYWYCEACGQAWLDEDCRFNTNLLAVVLPMTNHLENCPHTALIGNKGYATIQDAIAGAAAGSEIVLNSDVTVVGDLPIENQVIINLNGKTLTAGAVVTFYEGTQFIGEGKLVVAKNSLYKIKGETKYVPVWNAPVLGENDEVVTPGYYTFSEVKDQIKKSTVEDTEVVVFRPAFENKEIKKEFVDGAGDNGLSFVIRITWEGLAKPKEYTLTDEFIANVYNAEKPKAIQLGFENWQAGVEYTVTLRIVSGGIYYETTLCTMKDGAITVPKIVTE